MDHSPLNPTRIASVNGRLMSRSFNSSFSLSHHHFLNGSLRPLGSHPPPYNSLPCFARPSLHQPALLPLPDSKSTPALSPAKKTATTNRFNQQQHQRKSRPSKPKNGKATMLVTVKKSKAETWEEEREEREDVMESIYSISPPPSSLPLPRFSLPRRKSAAPASSCVMGAVEGGGIDIGATDGLRRLLRL